MSVTLDLCDYGKVLGSPLTLNSQRETTHERRARKSQLAYRLDLEARKCTDSPVEGERSRFGGARSTTLSSLLEVNSSAQSWGLSMYANSRGSMIVIS